MNYLFIILPVIAVVAMIALYIFSKSAQEIEEDVPVIKFQPRKVVDLSTPTSIPPIKEDVTPVSTETAVAPKKKKYYKKRPKKIE